MVANSFNTGKLHVELPELTAEFLAGNAAGTQMPLFTPSGSSHWQFDQPLPHVSPLAAANAASGDVQLDPGQHAKVAS